MSNHSLTIAGLVGAMSFMCAAVAATTQKWIYLDGRLYKLEAGIETHCMYSGSDSSSSDGVSKPWFVSTVLVNLDYDEGGRGGSVQHLLRDTCVQYDDFPQHLWDKFLGPEINLSIMRYMLFMGLIFVIISSLTSLIHAGRSQQKKSVALVPCLFFISSACLLLSWTHAYVFFSQTRINAAHLTGGSKGTDSQPEFHISFYMLLCATCTATIGFLISIYAVKRAFHEMKHSVKPIALRILEENSVGELSQLHQLRAAAGLPSTM